MQLDALAAADCREVIVETASTCGARPKLVAALRALRPGDTLVIYKPDRVARSMKELLVLLEDELHVREVNLEILTEIYAGLHKPNGQTIGISSHRRPSSSRPPAFGVRPPHCLKKNGTPAPTHASRIPAAQPGRAAGARPRTPRPRSPIRCRRGPGRPAAR
jgi:hypothetical protein